MGPDDQQLRIEFADRVDDRVGDIITTLVTDPLVMNRQLPARAQWCRIGQSPNVAGRGDPS